MRTLRILHFVILSVLIGGAAFVYAQDEKPQEDKAARQEEAKPQPKQDEAKPQPKQDDAKPSRPDDAKAMKQDKQDHRAETAEHAQGQDHPGQQQAHAQPAGKGHIPDDKFRANFGRSHTFTAKTVIVSGRPQFQYGGYSFQLVDVWPVGWAYTDECYIDYIDGEYFLFDLLHPGVRIAIIAVL